MVQLAGAEAARWAGRLGFAGGFAMLLLMPFAGALGDRFDRRRLLALSQVWLAAVALMMGVLAARPDGLDAASPGRSRGGDGRRPVAHEPRPQQPASRAW